MVLKQTYMLSLFHTYPDLYNKLNFISLGKYPAPVRKLKRLGRVLGLNDLYIKDDGCIGTHYGGNKVRKLEFLLGRASKLKAKEILTFGYAGSNHALATTIYAKHLGIKCTSILFGQPNAQYVRNNLLMCHQFGGELVHCKNPIILMSKTFHHLLSCLIKNNHLPYIIPAGGTSILSVIGYVNAVFELKEQIITGVLPEPDIIYVAGGTMGTAAGLILGSIAAGLNCHVNIIKVTKSPLISSRLIMILLKRTYRFLKSMESSFPGCSFDKSNIKINNNYVGSGYAYFTNQGMDAVDLMKSLEGLQLEGTYTGKTVAAVIDDAEKGCLANKKVLFWNTFNTCQFSDSTKSIDYRQLPETFHHYFEKAVQPFDRLYD